MRHTDYILDEFMRNQPRMDCSRLPLVYMLKDNPVTIKPGDRVRVLVNRVSAFKPGGEGKLKAGDIITVKEVQGTFVRYDISGGSINEIPINDVILCNHTPEEKPQPTPPPPSNPARFTLSWALGTILANCCISTAYYGYSHVLERIKSMNMQEFLQNPIIQTTNVAAYSTLIATVMGTIVWTALRYIGGTFGKMADRRRAIKIDKYEWEVTKKEAQEEKERKDREEREEREQTIRVAKQLAKTEKKRRRREERIFTTATPLRSSIETQALTPEAGHYARFTRVSSNDAKVYDPIIKAVRRAIRGDIIHILEIVDGKARYKHEASDSQFANFDDIEVIM